jgi:hypothetical protein
MMFGVCCLGGGGFDGDRGVYGDGGVDGYCGGSHLTFLILRLPSSLF